MARDKTLYTCRECGGTNPKWLGKCPHCSAWNTLEESVAESAAPSKNRFQPLSKAQPVTTLSEIEAADVSRTPTGLEELDRVLGGGIVEGGVVLIGGDPGIGKSTLCCFKHSSDALAELGREGCSTSAVKKSGEQVAHARASPAAARWTAARCSSSPRSNLEKILATLDDRTARTSAVIDSIQTVWSDQLSSAPGSVAQVRECCGAAHALCQVKAAATVILVGHVTKDGALAGPRVLEHIVDTVLYFEGDTQFELSVWCAPSRTASVRSMRLGVFAMTEQAG